MKYIYFLIAFFASLNLSAQNPGISNPTAVRPLTQEDVLRDTTFFQYVVADSVFYRIQETYYKNGLVQRNILEPVGDSVSMRFRLMQQYNEAANSVTSITIAYMRRGRQEARERAARNTYAAVFGESIQDRLVDQFGFFLPGNYRITSTVAGMVYNNSNCTIEKQGNRIRLLVAGEAQNQRFTIDIEGNNSFVIARRTGGAAIRQQVYRQEGENTFRNEAGTITIKRRN